MHDFYMVYRIFGILALGVLAQPLLHAYSLTFTEYMRLAVIVLGLGVMYQKDWRISQDLPGHTLRRWQIFLALVFMFIVTQFDPIDSTDIATGWIDLLSVVPLSCLFIIFALVFYVDRKALRALTSLDWVVVVVALFLTLLFIVTRMFSEAVILGWILVKLGIYLVSWFVFTRLVLPEIGIWKKAVQITIAVFVVVCIIGGLRTGQVFYSFHSAESSVRNHLPEKALAQYASATRSGKALKFHGVVESSKFAQAQILFSRGDSVAAAKVLDLSPDFSKVIEAGSWTGPAGGELYTNISCWRDLELYAGEIEVHIFARGQAAVNEWPRMKVMLGNQLLGERVVNSTEFEPYEFQAKIETGVQRLEISFLNDYYDLPEDRNLWIEQAEIRYSNLFKR